MLKSWENNLDYPFILFSHFYFVLVWFNSWDDYFDYTSYTAHTSCSLLCRLYLPDEFKVVTDKIFAHREKRGNKYCIYFLCSLSVTIKAIFYLLRPGPAFRIYDFNNGWEHEPGLQYPEKVEVKIHLHDNMLLHGTVMKPRDNSFTFYRPINKGPNDFPVRFTLRTSCFPPKS